jgi:photosystem II stability/assembly factor-like uncharacterized protein
MTMKRVGTVVAGLALTGALGAAACVATAQAAPSRPPGGPVPAGFEPASVTFISASDGWVLGTTRTCAHAPCTAVLRTTDGGRRWSGIPAPKFKLAGDNFSAGLIRLRFADAADGFAYGSQLWVTHNGGSGWHRVRQVPGDIGDLETSAGVAYLASQRGGKETIYSSPAGRNSWHRVTGLPRVSGSASLGTITVHGRSGWIILGNRIYATSNGSAWSRESFRCPAGFGIASLAAGSPKKISVLCSGEAGLGSTTKRVYVSADGGTSFTVAGRPPAGGDGGLLAEPAPRHLLIATSSGATWTYVSTDGGRKWKDGALSLDDGGLGWNDFGFTTASQGVAVEGTPFLGSKLWLTRDSGRHWVRVRF